MKKILFSILSLSLIAFSIHHRSAFAEPMMVTSISGSPKILRNGQIIFATQGTVCQTSKIFTKGAQKNVTLQQGEAFDISFDKEIMPVIHLALAEKFKTMEQALSIQISA